MSTLSGAMYYIIRSSSGFVLVADDAFFSFIFYLSNMLNQVVVILFSQAYIEKLLCTSLSCYTHPSLYFRDPVVLYFCDQGVFFFLNLSKTIVLPALIGKLVCLL